MRQVQHRGGEELHLAEVAIAAGARIVRDLLVEPGEWPEVLRSRAIILGGYHIRQRIAELDGNGRRLAIAAQLQDRATAIHGSRQLSRHLGESVHSAEVDLLDPISASHAGILGSATRREAGDHDQVCQPQAEPAARRCRFPVRGGGRRGEVVEGGPDRHLGPLAQNRNNDRLSLRQGGYGFNKARSVCHRLTVQQQHAVVHPESGFFRRGADHNLGSRGHGLHLQPKLGGHRGNGRFLGQGRPAGRSQGQERKRGDVHGEAGGTKTHSGLRSRGRRGGDAGNYRTTEVQRAGSKEGTGALGARLGAEEAPRDCVRVQPARAAVPIMGRSSQPARARIAPPSCRELSARTGPDGDGATESPG
ncbi:MAG: hypothetical protein K0Q72_3959 [Armatimonadetes bacterium]|nr:hypothetical protein [Armatimonadota bacterium]